ncbi:universal stress protein [Paractinoplanes brasiliensis]|uniref:Nucleotide-binding universal stress UspA family protein n=1 Tax=Paractinoplanes brasiliensis TaxID=52695 RepID=A0A4V3C8K4_9ACTN|nr:universal stress protein [Actinoplanes brasiliensis]TDO41978.1 nucleotide-binding universal stress UspA family protein [Actinoplanes brasiliensis]GID29740.1 universal stress protein [Actinoplanes brasiliensis]
MATFADAPVVVGVDGSPSSLDAVDLAAHEAELRGLRLHIVHAFAWPPALVAARPAAPGAAEPATLLRAEAAAVVEQAGVRAAKAAPGVTVTTEVADGPAAFVLLERSRRAGLIVVGDRGRGRFDGILAGTVATQLATYGSCPVIVVRGHARTGGPVVVGVDGSPRSARALEFAAEEAHHRSVELVAVHVWRTPSPAAPGAEIPLVYDLDLLEAEEGRQLAAALDGLSDRHPGLSVRPELGRGATGQVLTSWSRQAQLMVVGDRGHGGFVGLLLGSVSQYLIYHGACPVAVVRDNRRHG